MRARCALGAAGAARGLARELRLRAAARDARRIARERAPWAAGLALLLGAGIAAVRGDPEAGARLAREAAHRCEAAHLGLYAAAARRGLGMLVGGAEGGRARCGRRRLDGGAGRPRSGAHDRGPRAGPRGAHRLTRRGRVPGTWSCPRDSSSPLDEARGAGAPPRLRAGAPTKRRLIPAGGSAAARREHRLLLRGAPASRGGARRRRSHQEDRNGSEIARSWFHHRRARRALGVHRARGRGPGRSSGRGPRALRDGAGRLLRAAPGALQRHQGGARRTPHDPQPAHLRGHRLHRDADGALLCGVRRAGEPVCLRRSVLRRVRRRRHRRLLGRRV